MTEKSRHISLFEFFEQLQLEYLVAELRAKIYTKTKDKRFWKDRVMVGKREKIDDIIGRNVSLVSIFNNDEERKRLSSLIYPDFGLPNFFYRDEEQRLELEIKDFYNYFKKNSEVLVKTDNRESKPATLLFVTGDKEYALVKFKGDSEKTRVHIMNVARIL